MKQKFTFLLIFLFSCSVAAYAQNHRISGVVISAEDNSPIPGATLVVEGTTTGTNADRNGQFNLSVPNNATVVVEFLGMKPQRFTVTEPASNMRIVLDSEISEIDEVIVIAYGTTTRASFTGSASVVGADKLEARSISNLTSALEGNAPGIQMTSALGQPGASATIRIRGFGSFGASSEPLYVVDGAVFNGDLNSINPADIASMTVLKDAQSTALYGSSAGNGVILITTKKGTSQKGSITFSTSHGISNQAYKDYSTVDVWEYYPLQWEMLKNARITAGNAADASATYASNNIVSTLKNYNPYSGVDNKEVVGADGKLNPAITGLKWGDDLDWADAAYKTGYRQEYNMSYNSRTENSDTYASVGYLNDKGYMIRTDFERYTGRVNYNMNPVKWFKTGINLAMTRTVSNQSTATADNASGYGNLARHVRNMAPIYPIHLHDMTTGAYLDTYGNPTTNPADYVYDYASNRLSDAGRHGIAEAYWNERVNTVNNNRGTVYATVTPIEGLDVTVNYSINSRDYRFSRYENKFVGDGSPAARMTKQSTRMTDENLNQLINYHKSWQKHNFHLTLGHETNTYKYEYLYAMKTNEAVGGVYEFPNFVKIANLSSYTHTYNKEGYFGRLNYDYDSKYYFSASFRRDGTSRFHRDNRWGNFYSFGASWRISQEEFMKNVTWVDNLKLRASYGETGVDMVTTTLGGSTQNYYPYQTVYDLGENNGGEAGMFFNTIANPNLKWETQISMDVAVEFTLFGKLTGTIEYFRKDSKGLIFNVYLPTSNGVAQQPRNLGKSRNTGLEVALDYKILSRGDWRADAGFNITWLKNEFVRLPDELRETGMINNDKKFMEGKSRYEYWLYQWWGVDPDNGNGLYYMDTDAYDPNSSDTPAGAINNMVQKDGQILTRSYTYAKKDFSGHAQPDFMGGFNFHVGYKAFDLTANFSYQWGGKTLDYAYRGLMSMSAYGAAMHDDVKNAWRQVGDVTDVPRLDANSTHATHIGQSYSTRWLVSSDYLSLRSLSLSYNLPKTLLQKIQVSNARIILNAENLLNVKARRGLNPSPNFDGTAYNTYMPARVMSVALNVTF